jgi:hypothetical protein
VRVGTRVAGEQFCLSQRDQLFLCGTSLLGRGQIMGFLQQKPLLFLAAALLDISRVISDQGVEVVP